MEQALISIYIIIILYINYIITLEKASTKTLRHSTSNDEAF